MTRDLPFMCSLACGFPKMIGMQGTGDHPEKLTEDRRVVILGEAVLRFRSRFADHSLGGLSAQASSGPRGLDSGIGMPQSQYRASATSTHDIDHRPRPESANRYHFEDDTLHQAMVYLDLIN